MGKKFTSLELSIRFLYFPPNLLVFREQSLNGALGEFLS